MIETIIFGLLGAWQLYLAHQVHAPASYLLLWSGSSYVWMALGREWSLTEQTRERLFVKWKRHRPERVRKARHQHSHDAIRQSPTPLRINLLLPSRWERFCASLRWTTIWKHCIRTIPNCLFELFMLPMVLYFVVEMVSWWIRSCVVELQLASFPLVRSYRGCEANISGREAIDIAKGAVGFEAGFITIQQHLWTWDLYVERANPRDRPHDCKAVQVLVDVRDGRIVSIKDAPCEHHHDALFSECHVNTP